MIDYSKRDVNDVFVILVAHVLFTSYLHVVFNNYVKDFGETCFSCNTSNRKKLIMRFFKRANFTFFIRDFHEE